MSNLTEKNRGGDNNLSLFSLAWEMGWLITLPIVLLGAGGVFLDKKMGTSPWILLSAFGFSIIISSVAVYYKTMKVLGMINFKNDSPKSEKK